MAGINEYSTPNYGKISSSIGELLQELSEDRSLTSESIGGLKEICDLYATSFRKKILPILIPTIWALRVRIANGDVKYFSEDQFLTTISKEVEFFASEVWKKNRKEGIPLDKDSPKTMDECLKEIIDRVTPILEAIKTKAVQYNCAMNLDFETYLERISKIIEAIGIAKRASDESSDDDGYESSDDDDDA